MDSVDSVDRRPSAWCIFQTLKIECLIKVSNLFFFELQPTTALQILLWRIEGYIILFLL